MLQGEECGTLRSTWIRIPAPVFTQLADHSTSRKFDFLVYQMGITSALWVCYRMSAQCPAQVYVYIVFSPFSLIRSLSEE